MVKSDLSTRLLLSLSTSALRSLAVGAAKEGPSAIDMANKVDESFMVSLIINRSLSTARCFNALFTSIDQETGRRIYRALVRIP